MIRKYRLFLLVFVLVLSFSFFYKDALNAISKQNNVVSSDSSEFSQAILSRQTLYYIAHNYYDPARINPRQMLKAGLMAIARGAPEILVDFPEGANQLSVFVEKEEQKIKVPNFSKNVDLGEMVPILQQTYSFIEKHYKGDTELSDIERLALNGMLESLDPHSSLLSPKVFKEFRTQTEGEFGGLGIVIGLKEGDLTVISPLEGTPAWKAGIKSKDKILKINTEATINMNLNDAVEKMRGKVGTQVTLLIAREGVTDPFEITLTRAKIVIDSIQSKLISQPEGDVGYVKVKSFQEDTYRELVKNLDKLKSQSKNFKGLILDFRNNPGGLLSQAIQVSDLFLSSGVIVATAGAGDKVRETEEAKGPGTESNYPIMVLVNDSSASASEIVAAALKNNNRGVVLGQQTFGKGSVQSVYSLKDGSALKLTIAQYLTPGNESIQSVGITPDIQLVAATVTPNNTRILEGEGFREKDLEKHLESSLNQMKKPVYTLRYFAPKKKSTESQSESKPTNEKEDDSDEYSTELKLDNDYYVKLANKLILQAPGNDRQEILKNSLNVEKASEQEEDEKIKQAFSVIGIDWSKAEPSASPQANISFHLEGKNTNEAIKAGEEAQLTLTVQNTGKGDFYQLIAKIESENILLKNKEFVFGHVKSGETKSWTTKVKIPDNVLSREDVLKFVFREANNKNPEPFSTLIAFEPKDRPSFAYSYHLEPKTLQKGNNYSLVLKVKNMGSGKSKETIVNLKNMEGEGIYISEGRNKLGEMEPGSTKEAKLAFNISKTFSKDKVGLEFSIVDTSTQESLVDKVSFPLDKELNPKPDVVQLPPKIELNGMSGIRSSSSNKFPISGTITSETPIKDVIIFVGENKVFLKPADPASPKKLVFSTQVPLEVKNNNSNNLVIVVSRDERDLTSHESFFIRKK